MTLKRILIFLFIIFHAAGARAELYKWIDSAGRVNYVDDLSKVPSEYREQAVKPAAPEITVQSQSASSNAYEGRAQYRDTSGKGEIWWRNEADGIRTQIRHSEEDLEYFYGFQRDCEESQKNIISARNRDCGSLYSGNIERVKATIERLKKRLEIDLPEESRKAGALPGWLRESPDAPVRGHAGGDRDESWWRNRTTDLRGQLRTEQGKMDRYNEEEKKCEESQKYNTGCRKKNCKLIYEDRKKHAERRINELRQTLEVDLPDQARRAGADPGWLRE